MSPRKSARADDHSRADSAGKTRKSRRDAVPALPRATAHPEPAEAPPRDPAAAPISPAPRAVVPRPVPGNAPLDHPSLYFNAELGWLDFNWRVLHQARDPRVPLLERTKFLAICCDNLDEFYQKRVGGLKRQQAAGVIRLSHDGRTPDEQLILITRAALEMQREITGTWEFGLKPLLAEAGIVVSDYDDVTLSQREALDAQFYEHLYPVLTPLAVDPGHPFPFVSNLSLSLAVGMKLPDRDSIYFARVKVPTMHGRWMRVRDSKHAWHFVPVEQVIARNVGSLFSGMDVVSVNPFRVTRNADIARFEEEADDLISMISGELRERRSAPVVRLEVGRRMPKYILRLLLRELELHPGDVVRVDGPMSLVDCAEIAALEVPALRYPPWEPRIPPRLAFAGETEEDQSIFSVIRSGDILVHHPYESFNASVQRLLDEAADDPSVVAIKQTLYRTSPNSPLVRALLRAADRGKQVAVLVEVKARFDEANNIELAQLLENAGVHVAYGLVGLKTHAKVLLIIRQENGRPQPYCHVGTGNYHAGTARVYSDLGLFTADPAIGREVIQLFHSLTGHAPDQTYEKLLVAPRNMRRIFHDLIRREVAHRQEGREARIIAKMNALDDPATILELYRASRAGVQIDLIVRGHSRLRPGLPGFSANIRIVSIVGRFLEHDRIYWFANGGEPEAFIGSPDWRQRNLGDRIEVVVPVLDAAIRERLRHILDIQLSDNRLAFDLGPNGDYIQRTPAPGEAERNCHEILLKGEE